MLDGSDASEAESLDVQGAAMPGKQVSAVTKRHGYRRFVRWAAPLSIPLAGLRSVALRPRLSHGCAFVINAVKSYQDTAFPSALFLSDFSYTCPRFLVLKT